MTTTSKGLRLVCDLPQASHLISGIYFALIKTDADQEIRVSERVSAEVAEPLLAISGFRIFEGQGDDQAIDDALAKVIAADTAAAPASRHDASLAQQLEEHRRANRAQSEEIEGLKQQLAQLRAVGTPGGQKEEIDRLKADLARLDADRTTAANEASDAIQKLDAQRDGLTKQLEALQAEKGTLTQERDALVGQVTALQGEKDSLVSERDGLTKQLEALQAEKKKGGK